ncbi:histidinol-phosphate transaminase [Clostridiaceae bacterium 35-E11]
MKDLIKQNIGLLKPYVIPKESMHTKLDANENPFNLFDEIKEKFIDEIMHLELNRYPDTDSNELRELLAKFMDIKKENILCGNGSDEIIQIIINTFVDKEEYVITHNPTFSMYKIFTMIAGGRALEVSCENSFHIDIDQIIQEANKRKTKVIFLCNPNNPTGILIPRKGIEKIINSTKSIVVVDEAYYEFLDETIIDLVNQYERLIVLRTLSKAYALAGARIGYAVAHEGTMELLYRVKPPYNINVFSQTIGKLFLQHSQLIDAHIQKIKKERDDLVGAFYTMKDIEVFPTSSNFILIKSREAKKIIALCKENGIAVRGFENEKLLQDCIRITVGTREENRRLLDLMKKVVE